MGQDDLDKAAAMIRELRNDSGYWDKVEWPPTDWPRPEFYVDEAGEIQSKNG